MSTPSLLVISTGGTFNKVYNSIKGSLDIDQSANAIEEILSHWRCSFEWISIIGKDSLDMDTNDRQYLLQTIQNSSYNSIVVIHGTDTIDKSATLIASTQLNKKILFTGSMVPFSINPIEATANLALAIGYLEALHDNGVYIAMNGSVGSYDTIIKDRVVGKFIQKSFL